MRGNQPGMQRREADQGAQRGDRHQNGQGRACGIRRAGADRGEGQAGSGGRKQGNGDDHGRCGEQRDGEGGGGDWRGGDLGGRAIPPAHGPDRAAAQGQAQRHGDAVRSKNGQQQSGQRQRRASDRACRFGGRSFCRENHRGRAGERDQQQEAARQGIQGQGERRPGKADRQHQRGRLAGEQQDDQGQHGGSPASPAPTTPTAPRAPRGHSRPSPPVTNKAATITANRVRTGPFTRRG